ncbi:hypothetical protein pf16_46 [Pseudomonas phage pf16]|uniref:I-spanin n=1 Tax=Pseudomonas phage pf16 TaxID=1815630 RepID=A0A1S5R3J6_9CAUD|nr:Rz-like spanin [Pseudomonas phage pf16]AND74969.1 hypothetical protein pf16_46 [Pseudomonas phage pf16]
MIELIKGKLTAVMAVVCASLLALAITFGVLYTKQVETTAEVASNLSTLQDKFDDLEERIKADKEARQKLNAQTAASTQKFNDTKRGLERFTGREDVLRAKPSLTEKMINKSFNAFTDEISCTTGDSTPCLPRKP